MSKGTHEFRPDPRNEEIRIYVNGDLVPRDEARVSVFDSGFVLGDGVWEGLRVHRGRIAFLDAHLDRLYEGAKALDLDIGLDRPALAEALHETLRANAMSDDVHIRLMVSRGVKATPYQDPGSPSDPPPSSSFPSTRSRIRPSRRAGSACSPCTCAGGRPTCRIRSSTAIPSSTASWPASRRRRRAPTRR